MDEEKDLNEMPKLENDWLLEEFVRYCNEGMELTITLFVKGIIVSGKLIGGKNYFENVAETFKTIVGKNNEEDEPDKVYEHFVTLGKSIYDNKEEQNKSNPTFIHLKEARVFQPGQLPMPNSKSIFWRGKISSVDGFFIGELNIGK